MHSIRFFTFFFICLECWVRIRLRFLSLFKDEQCTEYECCMRLFSCGNSSHFSLCQNGCSDLKIHFRWIFPLQKKKLCYTYIILVTNSDRNETIEYTGIWKSISAKKKKNIVSLTICFEESQNSLAHKFTSRFVYLETHSTNSMSIHPKYSASSVNSIH